MFNFFDRESRATGTVFGPDIMRTSPQWFASFACRRVAMTLVQ